MMREGDKLASYRILAAALERLQHCRGARHRRRRRGAGGDRRGCSRPSRDACAFTAQIESRAELRALYEAADLFVWPAVNEAYGMVLLEAQALGCPVVAGAYGGVASVVQAWRDRAC